MRFVARGRRHKWIVASEVQTESVPGRVLYGGGDLSAAATLQ
jgi:hypothetical protein